MSTSTGSTIKTSGEFSRQISTDRSSSETLISKELARQDTNGNDHYTVKLVALDIKVISNDDIQLMFNVERLSLRKNQLAALPNSFSNLKNLRYLDLNSNNFREIPTILLQCPQLEILDLSSNKIKSLPIELYSSWIKNLKVLSLKNNRVSSINELRIITKLENLNVLEIEGNDISAEELALVQSYTPMDTNIPKDEYWAVALRRFFEDHPERINNTSTINNSQEQQSAKLTRASKRMGFINTPKDSAMLNESPVPLMTTEVPVSLKQSSNNITVPIPTSQSNINIIPSNSNIELYNHSKYNDYFKRLSILPEEITINEESRVSHAELVAASRKLLFSFTECQQAIRKIASFCKEKAIAVNVVSLLYSVRSHIDNLVEFLQQIDDDENANDQGVIKLCITIISIFKQIVTLLRKNFCTFFEEVDLCFVRMYYMTLLCSYSEIYNAWSFICPKSHSKDSIQNTQKSASQIDSSALSFATSSTYKVARLTSELNNDEYTIPESHAANINPIKHKSRTRSNTLQTKLPSSLLHTNSSSSDTSVTSMLLHPNSNEFPLNNNESSMSSIKGDQHPSVLANSAPHNESIVKEKQTNGSPSSLHHGYGHDMSRSASIKLRRTESAMERDAISMTPTTSNISHSISVNALHNINGLETVNIKSVNSTLSSESFGTRNIQDVVNGEQNDRIQEDNSNAIVNGNEVTNVKKSSRISRSNTKVSRNREVKNEVVNVQRSESNNKNQEENIIDSSQVNSIVPEDVNTETTETQQNIDRQLYEMLINVTKVVSVVYNQLTNEISRIAMASTTGEQQLTDKLASKIRELTDTCCQALVLAKTLNERLQLLTCEDPVIIKQYLTNNEKLKTWEGINAFLKSIISILGTTKMVMADLPNLNEIRPNLASLAKITKDVTVILDLSSYKAVSVTATQIQKQQQVQQVQQVQQQQQQQINSHTHVPLLTPQPVANNNQNGYPFEQTQ